MPERKTLAFHYIAFQDHLSVERSFSIAGKVFRPAWTGMQILYGSGIRSVIAGNKIYKLFFHPGEGFHSLIIGIVTTYNMDAGRGVMMG